MLGLGLRLGLIGVRSNINVCQGSNCHSIGGIYHTIISRGGAKTTSESCYGRVKYYPFNIIQHILKERVWCCLYL